VTFSCRNILRTGELAAYRAHSWSAPQNCTLHLSRRDEISKALLLTRGSGYDRYRVDGGIRSNLRSSTEFKCVLACRWRTFRTCRSDGLQRGQASGFACGPFDGLPSVHGRTRPRVRALRYGNCCTSAPLTPWFGVARSGKFRPRTVKAMEKWGKATHGKPSIAGFFTTTVQTQCELSGSCSP